MEKWVKNVKSAIWVARYSILRSKISILTHFLFGKQVVQNAIDENRDFRKIAQWKILGGRIFFSEKKLLYWKLVLQENSFSQKIGPPKIFENWFSWNLRNLDNHETERVSCRNMVCQKLDFWKSMKIDFSNILEGQKFWEKKFSCSTNFY